jgi:hypothetical protein
MIGIRNKASAILEVLGDRIHRQENYVATFTSPQGQKVLQHLCKVGHVTTSTMVPGDTHLTSYNEGKRDLVLAILRQVHKDPSALIKQIEEASNHE